MQTTKASSTIKKSKTRNTKSENWRPKKHTKYINIEHKFGELETTKHTILKQHTQKTKKKGDHIKEHKTRKSITTNSVLGIRRPQKIQNSKAEHKKHNIGKLETTKTQKTTEQHNKHRIDKQETTTKHKIQKYKHEKDTQQENSRPRKIEKHEKQSKHMKITDVDHKKIQIAKWSTKIGNQQTIQINTKYNN